MSKKISLPLKEVKIRKSPSQKKSKFDATFPLPKKTNHKIETPLHFFIWAFYERGRTESGVFYIFPARIFECFNYFGKILFGGFDFLREAFFNENFP